MKKVLAIILALMMILLVSTGVMAAVYKLGDTWAVTDTWFYVEDTKPYLYAGDVSFADADLENTVVEYYKNDQTFACIKTETDSGDFTTIIKGSYLFGFGLFLGLGNYSGNYFSEYNYFSPGFRLNMGENNYVAFSIDYFIPDGGDSQINNFAVDAKFLFENMKILGSLNIPQGDFADYYDTQLGLDFYYQVIDPLTIYAGLNKSDDTRITIGGTFKGVPHLVLDGKLQTESGDSILRVSGMFKMGNFGVGGEMYTENGESQITLKAKFDNEKNKFVFMYAPKTDYWSSKVSLAYELKFGEAKEKETPRSAGGLK